MELAFSRKDMSRAMQTVSRAVGRSATLPILSNVLISAARDPLWDVLSDASDGNGSIYVAATDLEIGIRTRIPGHAVDNGAITLPAKTFASVISALSEEDVKLTTSKDRATIRCHNGEFRMVGMSTDGFPSLMGEFNQGAQLELTEQPKDEKIHFLSLDSDALGWMIRKTSYAASRDQDRFFLNGVHLSARNGGSEQDGTLARMAATDGARLAVASMATEGSVEEAIDAIIPNRAIDHLEKLTAALGSPSARNSDLGSPSARNSESDSESDVVKIGIQENRIIFDMDHSALVSRLLEGEYPDYEQVIPDQSRINLKADTGHFLSVARRMAQVADPKLPCVRLEIVGNRLKVSASSAYVGDGCEEMDVDKEGDDITVAVNVRYLIDALRVIDSQETLIGINGAVKPIVIKPSLSYARGQASGDHLCVLMPVRL